MRRSLAVLATGMTLVVSACGGGGGGGGAAGTAAAGCTVGVSWNNYQEERWAKWDEPAMKKAIEAGGGKYISKDAQSSGGAHGRKLGKPISPRAQGGGILPPDCTPLKPAGAKTIPQDGSLIAA